MGSRAFTNLHKDVCFGGLEAADATRTQIVIVCNIPREFPPALKPAIDTPTTTWSHPAYLCLFSFKRGELIFNILNVEVRRKLLPIKKVFFGSVFLMKVEELMAPAGCLSGFITHASYANDWSTPGARNDQNVTCILIKLINLMSLHHQSW